MMKVRAIGVALQRGELVTILTGSAARRVLMLAGSSVFLAGGLAVAAMGGAGSAPPGPPVVEAAPEPVVLAAALAPGLLPVPDAEPPPTLPIAATEAAPTGPLPAPEPEAAAMPRAWRPTGPADVRVWSNGDSTSYWMSYWTLRLLTDLGGSAVQPEAEFKISSGLVRREFFDWYGYAERQLSEAQPTVVVFMVGANDALQGVSLERYSEYVAEMMDRMNAPARRVIWVGQPNVRRAELRAAIPALNLIFKEEAEKRPWVTFVDTWALTSDSEGQYAASLPGEDGIIEVLRADDGVHFTSAGGRRLSLAVVEAVFAPTREELAAAEATRLEIERTAP